MSRIGNRILSLPANVTLSTDGDVVTVKGPKGELSTKINKNITVTVEGNEVKLTRKNDNFKNFHGTANANIKNMIIGVSEGFEKKLESIGVGYRFATKGNELVVTAGYSHPDSQSGYFRGSVPPAPPRHFEVLSLSRLRVSGSDRPVPSDISRT